MTKLTRKEKEFLQYSNAIEGVHDEDSLQQAIHAWQYLKTQKILTPSVIKKTHKILMLNQRGLQPDEKGYFRRCQVFVGGRECHRWESLDLAVEEWCQKISMNIVAHESYIEESIRQDHIRYEKIHPFVDGNGRTGRMFMNWQRLKAGIPVLVIHTGKAQQEYYAWFK